MPRHNHSCIRSRASVLAAAGIVTEVATGPDSFGRKQLFIRGTSRKIKKHHQRGAPMRTCIALKFVYVRLDFIVLKVTGLNGTNDERAEKMSPHDQTKKKIGTQNEPHFFPLFSYSFLHYNSKSSKRFLVPKTRVAALVLLLLQTLQSNSC